MRINRMISFLISISFILCMISGCGAPGTTNDGTKDAAVTQAAIDSINQDADTLNDASTADNTNHEDLIQEDAEKDLNGQDDSGSLSNEKDSIADTDSGNQSENSNQDQNQDQNQNQNQNQDKQDSAQNTTSDKNDNSNTPSKDITDTADSNQKTEQENGSTQKTRLYSEAGAVHVNGTVLCDSKNKTVVMRGVSTHGLAWYPEFVNEEAFKTMRDEWGINCVRLAMYTAEYNGYCTGSNSNRRDLKKLIVSSVKSCKKLGLYVIVDWHILSDSNPLMYQSESISFFDEMSKTLASYDNVLYEICNEPNGGTNWEDISKYAYNVIPVIRANAPDSVIIVGTPTWSQEVDKAAAKPITGYDNIMYTLHFYADTHRSSLRNTLEKAVKAGLPVFVTEFGICDASGSGAVNISEANNWMKLLVKYNISSCIWALSNKAETCSLIRSNCTKTSGWSSADLSESGTWFVNWMKQNAGAIGSGKGGTLSASEDQTQTSSTDANEDAVQAKSASNANLEASVEIVNSWEADGKYYYQMDLKLTNNGNSTIDGWNVRIDFGAPSVLSQSWCCKHQSESSAVTLSPENYNSEIEAGKTRGDIGIIVCSDSEISDLKVAVQ